MNAGGEDNTYFKGRGAQLNTKNPYLNTEYVAEHPEGIDEAMLENSATQYIEESPKKVVNKVDSPDLNLMYSLNPYQGCEHGCIYCYARNSHQYWGYSAGLDFERKIIVKKNAPALLEACFEKKTWAGIPIVLSGNTDCYQPVERKLKITRRLLEVFLKYRNPVSIITKNALILRDLDLLRELNSLDLVHVSVSLTSLNEDLRQALEPRTVTAKGRLKVIQNLSAEGIPVRVMTAPIIPGLNSEEIPALIKAAAEAGASAAGYTLVRLNGAISQLFEDWVHKSFPDRAQKVLHLISECHQGKLNDSRFGTRMRGDGNIADMISKLFHTSVNRYLKGREMRPLNSHAFKRPSDQLSLF
ncbi:DNA repair photolyase [Anseongella ginsenosidimutans]|uniref:DNA repair photolyase n=1 Tax=Anseongella ginsenosidimutans TaxID=496056 RepID=A0A4R3KPG5_9SPHI|nr:PA0069 family radical SAM protein [Anseongella ginsenosidimutans]QEC53678.1 PA0069 family radical SAM protein [Anseongella ginsenosidimutans]TCS86072.1 DNA repair photolyase [Anseongella ginsenosidimutans]